MELNVEAVQGYLRKEGLDGWLLYDFQGLNPIAQRVAPFGGIVTRRWFLLVPASGRPVLLAHKIEEGNVAAGRAELRTYSGWRELEGELRKLLGGLSSVAMEYSPGNAIPYVSRVDAGTLELVRSTGVEVASSANLVQHFQARWTPEGLASHREAAAFLVGLVAEMFELAAGAVVRGESLSEYDLQREILRRFAGAGMVYEHPPIVAVGPNAANPHYEPTAETHLPIREGDLLLLDIFCRREGADTVQADITWTAYVGRPPVPPRMLEVFAVVVAARDRGVELIGERLAAGDQVSGWEVDDAVREVIVGAGYGEYFTHRTGHSLGTEVHGNGANIDNLETRDERVLEPGLGFTIEPGVYLPGEFGIRSEIDCYIGEGGLEVTTLPLQRELRPLLS